MFGEVLGTRNQDRRDLIPIFDEHRATSLQFKPRYPRLHGPHRIELLSREKRKLVGIGGRDDIRVAAGLGDPQSAGNQPCARGDILRIAELRRADPLAAKIGGFLRPLSFCTTSADAPFTAPATTRTSAPRERE